jgi:serpin B
MFRVFFAFLTALSTFLSADLTQDHTEFALSLYPTLDKEDQNLIFSPYSIATCLSMVYLGARGDTQAQMASALHLEVDRKNLGKAAYALHQSLLPKENSYQLNMANAIWVDKGAFLLADFRYAVEEQFKAKVGKIDFSVPESALSTINGWISKETQGKIPKLLDSADISPMTRLVLTNAVFFQGAWRFPFKAEATQEASFYCTPEESKTVDMMHQTLFAPYYENEMIQAIALPFNGGGIAFVVIMPKSSDNFLAMSHEFSASHNEWFSSLKSARIALSLPKFTLSNRFDLNKPLQELGMEDAFESSANFTGIDGMQDLFLSKVVHEAFFDLDEKGVTAAAATAAGINATAVPAQPPINMVVDHPFLFFIIDLKSQEMLFMGKMMDPGTNK